MHSFLPPVEPTTEFGRTTKPVALHMILPSWPCVEQLRTWLQSCREVAISIAIIDR